MSPRIQAWAVSTGVEATDSGLTGGPQHFLTLRLVFVNDADWEQVARWAREQRAPLIISSLEGVEVIDAEALFNPLTRSRG